MNTPIKTQGIGSRQAANIKNCELAARNIAKVVTRGKIIVEKSTVPVRTADAVRQILACNEKGLKLQVLSNPEFLAEGTAIDDLKNPSRVLIGGEQIPEGLAAIKTLVDVCTRFVSKKKVTTTNLWSLECSKLVTNAFLAQRVLCLLVLNYK